MYHSITFGTIGMTVNGVNAINGKNTWDDWHLIPSSRPSVALPEPNTNIVDIPFRDGSLDISEAVTGYMTYKDRSGSWEFYIANDYESWTSILQKITNYLHGQKMFVVLEDDPAYCYEGRIRVDEFKSQKVNSTITISYVLKPYKRKMEWTWDDFNFETDTIESDVPIATPCVTTVVGGRMRSSPEIISSATGITVSINGHAQILLTEGKNVLSDVFLDSGLNTFEFRNSENLEHGTVVIHYTRGEL